MAPPVLLLVLALLCSIRGVPYTTAPLQAPRSLQAAQSALSGCLESSYNRSARFTILTPSSGKASSIHVLGMRWSATAPAVPLTLTTQLSMSRVDQLQALCASWLGPLSAVVYSLSQQTAEVAALQTVDELFRQAESSRGCQLDVMLVEDTGDADGFPNASFLYPVNILRNWARLQARTPYIGLVDVDMLVSRSLFQNLMAANDTLRIIAPPARALLVIPAFQVLPGGRGTASHRQKANALVDTLIAKQKEALGPYWCKVLFRFNPGFLGHRPTNYSRWFTAKAPYEVQHTANYEPWVLADRVLVPWYDSRFRSFGLNKVSQLHAAAAARFKFIVHPHAFMIHREHPITPMAINFRSGKWSRGVARIHRYNSQLYDQIRKELAQRSYRPKLDPGMLRCLQTLHWWTGVDGGR